MKNGDSPLHAACLNKHYSIVQLLMNNGADVNLCKRYSESPLFIACRKGHDSIVQSLLKNGANIKYFNEFEVTPLYLACQKDTLALLNLCWIKEQKLIYVKEREKSLGCSLKKWT